MSNIPSNSSYLNLKISPESKSKSSIFTAPRIDLSSYLDSKSKSSSSGPKVSNLSTLSTSTLTSNSVSSPSMIQTSNQCATPKSQLQIDKELRRAQNILIAQRIYERTKIHGNNVCKVDHESETLEGQKSKSPKKMSESTESEFSCETSKEFPSKISKFSPEKSQNNFKPQNGKFECEFCSENFQSKYSAEMHLARAHGVTHNLNEFILIKERKFYNKNPKKKCIQCEKLINPRFFSDHRFWHFLIDMKKVVKCKLCDVKYINRTNLRIHFRKNHKGAKFEYEIVDE